MKLHKKIPFVELKGIPDLITDFLKSDLPGTEEHLFSQQNFKTKIASRGRHYSTETREILCEVLSDQMAEPHSSEQIFNLKSLRESNTFTITTGHQLNLFSGPVFFIYKILQTIKTAQYLTSEFPEYNFVPVFWMATEDHDFEEICFFNTEQHRYEMQSGSGGAVGRIVLEDVSFISRFEKEFQDSVFGTELILMLKEAYKPGNTLADATRTLVNGIFAEYGLLILDGDDARLKNLMIPAFSEELNISALSHSVSKQVQFLTERYGKVQVNPREINLFYLSASRNRIDKLGDRYVLADSERTFTSEELHRELTEHPEKFSPNALMRPVYQETVLPNVAYIGGNAEIMYWLELTDYFKDRNIPFPVLIPRNSFLNITNKTLQKVDKNQLQIDDFFGDYGSVINSKLLENNEIRNLLKDKAGEVAAAFQSIRFLASRTDKTFGNLVAAEETRQLKSYRRMQKRLLRAEKVKQYERVAALQALYKEVHPGNKWQERVYNFSVFYSFGGSAWLKSCLKEMEVTQASLVVMVD